MTRPPNMERVSPNQAARPLVALLTDFGPASWYQGVMRGVIKGICPGADVVDVTHGISRQSVAEGALALLAAYPRFPAGTIFVAVVDPGVGTRRGAALARAAGRFFIGPNNGILGLVAQREPEMECRALTNAAYFLPDISGTFHGRDVFAPAAAHLAAGVPVSRLAPRRTPCVGLPSSEAWHDRGSLLGDIICFDPFGNAITNIPRELFSRHFRPGEPLLVHVGGRVINGIVRTYGDVEPGEPLAYWGSLDFLEIAVCRGNARDAMDLCLMEKVRVHRAGPGGR